ncbi:MAG TPA: hypothetical protein VFG62_18965 [Rhodopila sp.]|nr:hypothetical protein [Rhodopila sp.]
MRRVDRIRAAKSIYRALFSTNAAHVDGLAVLAGAALLLWPAIWNRYPIVFADTGTYLSQAIDRYAGWDRPVFYSIAIFPLHAMRSLWPVVAAQALLTAWLLRRICRLATPSLGAFGFLLLVSGLGVGTCLPWLVSEVMPDLLTPLLILVLWALAWRPEWMTPRETLLLIVLAAFMIATQQSSVPLSLAIAGVAMAMPRRGRSALSPAGTQPFRSAMASDDPVMVSHDPVMASDDPVMVSHDPVMVSHDPAMASDDPVMASDDPVMARLDRAIPCRGDAFHPVVNRREMARSSRAMTGHSAAYTASRRHSPRHTPPMRPHPLLAVLLPPILAVLALCTANLAAHGRFAISPYGNVFLLARVLYDGPGMEALQHDCPNARWRLCAFRNRMPASSDAFLWTADSPLNLAGGPKQVSTQANAIIHAALRADPIGAAAAALRNTLAQLTHFASGDGLSPWPDEVTPVITTAFPAAEVARYAAARQQAGVLTLPPPLPTLHRIVAIAGVIAALFLLPNAWRRRNPAVGLLIVMLVALPVSAAVTGALSGPHDRYQARLMWLPAFVVPLVLVSARRPARR